MISLRFKGIQCDYCGRMSVEPVGKKDLCLLHLIMVLWELNPDFVPEEEARKAIQYLSREEVENLV